MKVNFKRIKYVVKENIFGMMEIYMKAGLKIIVEKEKEY